MQRALHYPGYSGDYRERVTPLPIPNREVKPLIADGTTTEGLWESKSSPGFYLNPINRNVGRVLYLYFIDTSCRVTPLPLPSRKIRQTGIPNRPVPISEATSGEVKPLIADGTTTEGLWESCQWRDKIQSSLPLARDFKAPIEFISVGAFLLCECDTLFQHTGMYIFLELISCLSFVRPKERRMKRALLENSRLDACASEKIPKLVPSLCAGTQTVEFFSHLLGVS